MEPEAVLGSMEMRIWPREVETLQVHQLAVQGLWERVTTETERFLFFY